MVIYESSGARCLLGSGLFLQSTLLDHLFAIIGETATQLEDRILETDRS